MDSNEPNTLKISSLEKEKHVRMTSSQADHSTIAYSNKSEQEIWSEFKAGHRGALTYIYQKYVDKLFNYGCQFTANQDLVKDCIQELFMHIIRKKENLSHTDSIRAYLFKSFRRKLFKQIGKEARMHDKSPAGVFSIEVSPELNFIRDQLSKRQSLLLEKYINQLPEKQREAILLYFYEGIPYSQIAEILQMTKTKSARALLYRAIESLSKYLKPYKDTITTFFAVILWQLFR